MSFDYKKSLGQNFLKDNNIINKIVMSSEIDKDTLVIEVGPGAGSLSKEIVPRAKNALLYEIDTRLKDILNSSLSSYDNYDIIFNDVLKQDIANDIKKYEYKKLFLVANLPYYITSPIITKFINEVYPDRIVIMIQDEVADRFSASVGTKEYGMITVLLNAKYNVYKLFKVSKNCFEPIPNVDSAVVLFDKRTDYKIDNESKFEQIIKDAFQFKRKNLRNNLKKYDLNKIQEILFKYNLDLSCRAEEISTEIFIDISNNI